MNSPGTLCVAALVVTGSLWAVPAGASQQMNFQSIVQFGAQVKPVTVTQNAQFNGVGILQVGGSTTSATVTQNGSGNYVGVLQFGTTGAASVTQSGASNFSFIGQTSIPTFKP